MFWGIDLVKDKENRTPDKHLANTLTDLLRNKYGILISADGPYSNVLKIKPPMCFTESDLYEVIKIFEWSNSNFPLGKKSTLNVAIFNI